MQLSFAEEWVRAEVARRARLASSLACILLVLAARAGLAAAPLPNTLLGLPRCAESAFCAICCNWPAAHVLVSMQPSSGVDERW